MKKRILATTVLILGNYLIFGQEIPGLNYCLLFDSKLEKTAFQDTTRNTCDPMVFLMAYDPKIDSTRYEAVKKEIMDFVSKLEVRRGKSKNELQFLSHVFYKVHNTYLKQFKSEETFTGIFNNRSYNCVSGTALYASILSDLGYSPEIYETRYHIFLQVRLKDSTRILFEATDPLEGFVTKAIDQRITRYLNHEIETVTKHESISAPFNRDPILQKVSLVQVGGLHYYNFAVDLVNKKNYYDAFRALKKANLLYPDSKRITDLLEFTQLKYDAELSEAFANK